MRGCEEVIGCLGEYWNGGGDGFGFLGVGMVVLVVATIWCGYCISVRGVVTFKKWNRSSFSLGCRF